MGFMLFASLFFLLCVPIFLFLCKKLGEDIVIVRISIKKKTIPTYLFILKIFGTVLFLLFTGFLSCAGLWSFGTLLVVLLDLVPESSRGHEFATASLGSGFYVIIVIILLLLVWASISAYRRGRDMAQKEFL